MPNSKGKAKANANKKKAEKKSEDETAGEGDSALAVIEQLDFVSELLYRWRDSLVHQLAAAESKEELDSNFGYLFLKDRRVFPGEEEGWADSRRRISEGVKDPFKECQREALESFLDVIRNTKNYAKLSSNELAAFNKVMDEAMLKWALSQRVNMDDPELQDSDESSDPMDIATVQ